MGMRKILVILLFSASCIVFAGDVFHTVKKDETLYAIARRYNIPVEILIKLNGIKDPKHVAVGLSLRIPSTHIVVKGDTLFQIAKTYGTTVTDLLSLNGLKPDSILKPGDSILLPSGIKEQDSSKTSRSEESSPGACGSVDGKGLTADADGDRTRIPNADKQEGKWPLTGERMANDGKFSGARIVGVRGDVVVSVNTGRVVWEGPYRGFGRVIIVESENGYLYVYGGNEQSLVKVGDSVQPNMEIAKLGTNPHEGKAVLYFSVFKDGKPVDPVMAPRGL